MTPVFAARRRAEAFHSLIEGEERLHDARYAEFQAIVDSLRAQPPVEPRPEFVSALRERLMTAADTLLVPDDEARLTLPARRPARERRIAITVGGVAIVGATTSMALAAQSALPGDTLYPLKRAIENAETGLNLDQADRGTTLLANATGRLAEVRELSHDGATADGAAIAQTLTVFTEQAVEASDLLLADYAETGNQRSIAELRDFTGTSMETLSDLEAVVPAEARDELISAARVLTQIDLEAARTCPTCGGDGIAEIPRILTQASYATPLQDGGSPQGTVKEAEESTTFEPKLPETDGENLPPASVLQPPSTGGSKQSPDDGPGETTTDPIDQLTAGLTGDGDSQPTSVPGEDEVTVLDDAEQLLDGVTDPLLNP